MVSVNWVGVPNNASGNDWSNPLGWSNDALPGSGDTITVQAGSQTLVLASINPGTTTTDITVAAATVANGATWAIQHYPHTATITGSLEVDGSMSVTSDPFDTASMTLDIGGTLIVTNSGGGISIGGFLQGAQISPTPSVASTVFVQAAAVTNNIGTSNGTITVQSDAADLSTATLDVLSAAGISGQTGVLVGNINIGGDGLHEGGAGLLEFSGGGEITTIQGANANFSGASLFIYGSQSFVADSVATTSNSALTGLATINGGLTLLAGASVSTTGAVTIGNNGTVAIDTAFEGVAGSKFAVGGVGGAALTLNGILSIGRQGMIGNGLVTASALSSTGGTISMDGANAGDMGELVIGSAAGFGTTGTLTGNVDLQDFSLIEFTGGGPISTIAQGAALEITSAHAFLADASSLTTNSALTGLTTVNGELLMQGGAQIAPTASVTIGSNGSVQLDGGFDGLAGSVFAVTNSLTVNGTLSIGRQGMIGNGLVTASALSSTGTISMDGADASDMGELVIGAAAGFGTLGVLTGNVSLQDYSLIEFTGGSISTIAQGAFLQITSAHAFLADVGSLTSNSALTGLTTVNGQIAMQDGGQIAPTGSVTIGSNGTLSLDTAFFGTAGSLFAVTNTLTDNGGISIGRLAMTGIGEISAGSLMGTGLVFIDGQDNSDKGELIIAGSLGLTGTITLEDFSLLEIGTTATGGGTIAFASAAGTVKFDTATSSGDVFSGFTVGDKIDLASLSFAAGDHAVWQQTSGNSGSLSVLNGGGSTIASFNLAGQYSASSFESISDGAGGTLIEVKPAQDDFFHAGTSDILFRDDASGDTGFYQISNGANIGWHDIGATSTAYGIAGIGDFTGSGTDDILFRDNAGAGDTGFYQMNSGANTGWHDIGATSTAYSVVGIGDFTGSGTDDILFRDNTGAGDTGFYQMVNGANTGWHDIGATSTAYSVVGVGDFTGSGTDDILFRDNAGAGDTGFFQMVNGVNTGWHDIGASSTAYSVVGVGDFMGNGTDDILFRDNSTGDTGFYDIVSGVNTGWHDIGASSSAYSVIATGDYTGDGTSDILFRNAATGDTGFYAISTGVNTGWHAIGVTSTAYHVVS